MSQLLGHGALAVLAYSLFIQVALLVHAVAAAAELRRARAETSDDALDDAYSAHEPQRVSILMPAYNEEPVIVAAVISALANEWPDLEVIVVNDGSTDATFATLEDAFDLHVLADWPVFVEPAVGALVRRVARSRTDPRLVVIDKESGGAKAAALNTALAIASGDWVLAMDGDEVLDPDVIGRCMTAVRASDGNPVAVGGSVLPVNASTFVDGRVDGRVPSAWLTGCQTVEYLRAFVVGRAGMGALDAVAMISGAFGLFRTDIARAVGGWQVGHLGEDLDFTIRVHRHLATSREPYEVLQVPEAVVWTEVPSRVAALRSQRQRWHRGLTAALGDHAGVMFRRPYGRLGTVGIPNLVAVEWFAPLVETFGVVLAVYAAATGALNVTVAAGLFLAAVGVGIIATLLAVHLEGRRFGWFHSPGDTARLVGWAVIEPLGFRQLTVLWRVESLIRRGRGWGEQTRSAAWLDSDEDQPSVA